MTPTRPEWTFRAAPTRGLRGPDALEYVAVACIILAVMLAAVPYMPAHVRVVRATEALVLSQPFKVDMAVQHALYGRWPDASDPGIAAAQAHMPTRHIRSATLGADAVVSMRLRLRPHADAGDVLSFRPVLLGAPGARALMFVCGHALPPADAVGVMGTDNTTLPGNDLPFACRGPH